MSESDKKCQPETATAMDAEEESFSLSFELAAHSNPVRCVAVAFGGPDGTQDVVVTAETDGLLHKWTRARPEEENCAEFVHQVIFDTPIHGDKKLLFCLEPVKDVLPATFVSGGSDNSVQVWTADGERQLSMEGHTAPVNSICQTNKGHFVTGSFDTTAKIWKNGRCLQTLEGHQYGVEVCALTSGEIVTGSYQHLHIWHKGKITKTIQNAHEHVIRRILRHPLGFVSCANDGFVKVWSNVGDLLQSIVAHPVRGETASFVYSIAVLSDGSIVSGGEDATAKVWAPDGSLAQVIDHPTTVRSVCALPNGDFVTCSGTIARIFTRNTQRKATEKAQQNFTEFVQASHVQPNSGGEDMEMLDPTKYPGPEALDQPGESGEMKIVNTVDRGLYVYQWDAHMSNWKEVGQAVGRPREGDSVARTDNRKAIMDGKEFDHVTHVYVNEDQKASLGFNVDDDPTEVAIKFCERYGLDRGMHLQEIVKHLQPLADPIKRAQKLARIEDARRNAYKQIPSWKHGGYEIQTTSKPSAMRVKIEEFNQQLLQENNPNAIKSGSPQIQLLDDLIAVISDTSSYHINRFSPAIRQLLAQLLNWPTSKVLPVLDAIRVLMCHSGAISVLGSDPEIRQLLFKHASQPDTSQLHLMVLCRAISNWIAKRPRSDEERKSEEPPKQHVEYISEALNNLADAAQSNMKSAYTAYVMLAHNVMVWYGKYQVIDSDIYMQISGALFEMLNDERSEKATFYALLTIGTIAFVSENARTMIREVYGEQISQLMQKYEKSQNTALREVVFDLKKEFQ